MDNEEVKQPEIPQRELPAPGHPNQIRTPMTGSNKKTLKGTSFLPAFQFEGHVEITSDGEGNITLKLFQK